jgi:hypothetical protein
MPRFLRSIANLIDQKETLPVNHYEGFKGDGAVIFRDSPIVEQQPPAPLTQPDEITLDGSRSTPQPGTTVPGTPEPTRRDHDRQATQNNHPRLGTPTNPPAAAQSKPPLPPTVRNP